MQASVKIWMSFAILLFSDIVNCYQSPTKPRIRSSGSALCFIASTTPHFPLTVAATTSASTTTSTTTTPSSTSTSSSTTGNIIVQLLVPVSSAAEAVAKAVSCSDLLAVANLLKSPGMLLIIESDLLFFRACHPPPW